MQHHYNITLASGSPRRKEILEKCGFSFSVRAVNADESFPKEMPVFDVAEYVAVKKADAYGRPEENEIVITADTTVIYNNSVLNKPRDEAHALEMLSGLSGSDHYVVSGVCIKTVEKQISFAERTKVSFAALSKDELLQYIKKEQPFDKAGAYGIQESIGLIGVKSISGSYSNVVGLPAARVYRELKKLIS